MANLSLLVPLHSSDTPHGLKSSGFCAVAHTDVFSRLLTSYAGMRQMPYAHGGCHVRNNVGDTKFPTILVPDVHGSNSIPMVGPSTLRAPKHSSLDLAAHMPTAGTGAARVVFILQGELHAPTLPLLCGLQAKSPV